jgi:hypothetical protein
MKYTEVECWCGCVYISGKWIGEECPNCGETSPYYEDPDQDYDSRER